MSENPLVDNVDIHTSAKLTPEYAAKLLFNSFRFSQGDLALQTFIFDYIHEIHPDWRITEEEKEKIHEAAKDQILKFVLPSQRESGSSTQIVHEAKFKKSGPYAKMTDAEYVDDTIDLELGIMKRAFTGTHKALTIPAITTRVLDADYKHLSKPHGRERKVAPGTTSTTFTDPFLSHIYHFAIEGNTTGVPEFDQMFKEVKGFLEDDSNKDQVDKDQLEFVIQRHKDTHDSNS